MRTSACASRSSRGLRKTRQRFPPPSAAAWRSARKSPTPCRTTCCATLEGTERQEEDVAQHLGGLQEYRRITPMALFALQACAADAGEPGPPESLADGHRAGVQLADSACHRRRTSPRAEQAGIAQGAQFVEADAGEISMPRSGSARRRACSSSLARPARALAPTVEALPLMYAGSGAAPGHRPRRAGVRAGRRGPACPERSAATPGRSAPVTAETPDDIAPAPRPVRPRPLPLPARLGAAPAEMTGAGKAPGALRSASPHGRSCPPAGFAVGQRGVGGHGQIGQLRRSACRRGFSGSPRDHRYPASACPSAPRRTARSPPAPERPPARRRRGPPGRLAAQQLGGDLAVQRCPPLPADTPRNRWVRSTGRGGGLPGRPVRRATHAAPSRPAAWA